MSLRTPVSAGACSSAAPVRSACWPRPRWRRPAVAHRRRRRAGEERVEASEPAKQPPTRPGRPRPRSEVVFSNSTSAGDPTRIEAWDKLLADFEKTNPSIAVKKQYVPDTEYYDKMVAQAATGTLPDVVSNRSDKMETWAASKILLELDDYIRRPEFKLDDLYPESRKVGSAQGQDIRRAAQHLGLRAVLQPDSFDKASVPTRTTS